jgi:hypothetical protein
LSVVDFEGGVGKVLHCPVFGKVGELWTELFSLIEL